MAQTAEEQRVPHKIQLGMAQARTVLFVALWFVAVALVGATLMSFHQPFREPDVRQLGAVFGTAPAGQWRMIHVLSGGCGCSQRVMKHLLQRRAAAGTSEMLVIADDGTAYLEGSEQLLTRIAAAGIPVRHTSASELNAAIGLNGVPLLLIADPSGRVWYSGGYGERSDADSTALEDARAGRKPRRLAVIGCAVGEHLKQQLDPAGLKYTRSN